MAVPGDSTCGFDDKSNGTAEASAIHDNGISTNAEDETRKTILRTEYKAATNRMLRVAVNGFMESLGVVLGIMEELDVDVLAEDYEAQGA